MTPHIRGDELWGLEKLLFENIFLSFSKFKNIFDKSVWKIVPENKYAENKDIRVTRWHQKL